MIHGASPERSWVSSVAHNRAMSHLAQRRPPPEDIEHAKAVPDPAPCPEEVASDAERREALFTALRRLSVGQRQILGMALDGLAARDIAEVLGISENNVGVRLNRARSSLREALQQVTRKETA